MFVLVSLVSLEGEKMIFLILLLLFLTPCVSGTFVVNVTQTSYQAEENQNITLEWTFSTRRETNFRSISTICFLYTNDRTSVLFELREGVESPESQDPEFAGRVQWDKDVLTEGRLTLHVSRLRTSDSGFYVCAILVRPDGINSRRCWLSVTAAAELQTQRPTESPQPESWRNFWIYVGLPVTAFLLSLFAAIFVLNARLTKSPYRKKVQCRFQTMSSSEKQTQRV
ncbi:uncharacterized protein LOC117484088 isoform X2 [Trematomus bernacchii]|uniref:uncharacterized protein LOC117484088 isoform X2 n=2 Tax=Trematomus bernacchii TaxID=40690 RepID=UPI00146D6A8F|nr:uncharacterized protein LOC117484088 isoform X2 [Trematomus bernacchii]